MENMLIRALSQMLTPYKELHPFLAKRDTLCGTLITNLKLMCVCFAIFQKSLASLAPIKRKEPRKTCFLYKHNTPFVLKLLLIQQEF